MGAPLWQTGDKGAPPSPQMLVVRRQLRRKGEAPSSPPTQTQLSTAEVNNVPKQDDQGNKCTLTAWRIEDIEDTPPARFRTCSTCCGWSTLTFLWNMTLQVFFQKWLFDVVMLGKDVTFYGDADVVHRIGRDM